MLKHLIGLRVLKTVFMIAQRRKVCRKMLATHNLFITDTLSLKLNHFDLRVSGSLV